MATLIPIFCIPPLILSGFSNDFIAGISEEQQSPEEMWRRVRTMVCCVGIVVWLELSSENGAGFECIIVVEFSSASCGLVVWCSAESIGGGAEEEQTMQNNDVSASPLSS